MLPLLACLPLVRPRPVSLREEPPAIPLTAVSDGFCVDASLGEGVAARFLLDTGSAESWVTEGGAAWLRLAGAKADKEGTYVLDRVEFGGASIPSPSFGSLNWDPDFAHDFPAISGILGLNVLARFRVGLDLRAGTMRLWPADRPLADVRREWLGLSEAEPKVWETSLGKGGGELFYVPVRINGRHLSLCLDTGTPYTFVVPKVERSFHWGKPAQEELLAESRHPRTLRTYEAIPVGIGDVDLPGKHRVSALEQKNLATGVLGADVLREVRTLFDFPGRRAYFVTDPPKP